MAVREVEDAAEIERKGCEGGMDVCEGAIGGGRGTQAIVEDKGVGAVHAREGEDPAPAGGRELLQLQL